MILIQWLIFILPMRHIKEMIFLIRKRVWWESEKAEEKELFDRADRHLTEIQDYIKRKLEF